MLTWCDFKKYSSYRWNSVNKECNKIIFIAIWVLFGVMAIVTGMLIVEYKFFKERVAELAQLKEDYNNYVLALKKTITECDRLEEEQEQKPFEGEKKKLNEKSSEGSFLVINRESRYLREGAVSFARQHNLEPAVKRLYGISETPSRSRRKKSRIRRRLPEIKESDQEIAVDTAHEALFHYPIERKEFWLSCPFGPRRRPGGKWEFHRGIDMAAVHGTRVKAAAAGVVIEAAYARGYGNTIVIAHNRKFKTRYAHLSKIVVRVGDKIVQGQYIGRVGATGNVRGRNGSHLHFEVSVYDKRVNPLYFLA